MAELENRYGFPVPEPTRRLVEMVMQQAPELGCEVKGAVVHLDGVSLLLEDAKTAIHIEFSDRELEFDEEEKQ